MKPESRKKSGMKLFVQNQTEEYICDVSAEPDVLNCSKLLVVSYCRDPDITGPKYELMCVITPKSEEDERKYLSFVDYVIARKKVPPCCHFLNAAIN